MDALCARLQKRPVPSGPVTNCHIIWRFIGALGKTKRGRGEVVEESKGVDRQRRANGNGRKCVKDVSKNILLINARLAVNKYIRMRACLYACVCECVE